MAKIGETVLAPCARNLVVKRQNPNTVTEGGILIPDKAQRKSQLASVVAVGPGEDAGKRPAFAPGDTVLISTYAGHEIEHEGDTFLIVRDDEILAKVVPVPKGK